MPNFDESGQDWSAWIAAIDAGKSPKKDSEILSGYWRSESAAGYATPVSTIFDETMMQIRFNGGEIIDTDCGDDWHRFATSTWPKLKAVEHEDYETAMSTGFWPDGLPTTKRDAIGGNEGPEDAVEAMLKAAKADVEKARALVAAGAAKTQKAADAAAVLVGNLTKAKAALLEQHQKEKEPWLEGGRAVDARFLPLTKEMNLFVVDVKKKVSQPFLVEKERIAALAQAAAQKVIDDAAAAERAAEAASRAEQQDDDAGEGEKPPPVSEEEWQQAAPAVTVSAVKVTSGAKGSRVTLKDKRFGVITDAVAFATYLIGIKNAEIMAVLDQSAQRLARHDLQAQSESGTVICDGLKLEIRREA